MTSKNGNDNSKGNGNDNSWFWLEMVPVGKRVSPLRSLQERKLLRSK
jgi:hypothetical protein